MPNRICDTRLSSITIIAGCLVATLPALAADSDHVAAIHGSENHCGGAELVACDLSGADLSGVSLGLFELDKMSGADVNFSFA